MAEKKPTNSIVAVKNTKNWNEVLLISEMNTKNSGQSYKGSSLIIYDIRIILAIKGLNYDSRVVS